MRCGWTQAAYGAALWMLLPMACSEAPEESTVGDPVPETSEDEQDTVIFEEDPGGGDDCCTRFCAASIETGCQEYGATMEACVINLCPIPGALEEPEASVCREAQGEAVCCSWRTLGADGCALVDAHGTAECGSEATAADDACRVP